VSTRILPVEHASDGVAHSVWLDGLRETADKIGARGYAYAPYAHVGDPVAIEPHMLVLYVGGRTSIERAIGRNVEHEEIGPGDLSTQSTLASSVWSWTHPIEVLHVYISPLHLRQMARRAFDDEITGVRLNNQLRVKDPVITQLGFDLIAELRAPTKPGHEIAARAIGDRLLVELLRNHAELERARHGFDGATAARIREYVDSHVGDRLELPILADVAGYGVHHFCRLFRETFGQSPHEYVRERRLEAARKLLATTDTGIGEIAAECGFADQSHLTRCFKSMYGTPPARWRVSP
jgi:AraC family transcriptional regulator